MAGPMIRISGVEGLEGEYELLIHFLNTRYTTLELRKIKQKTGLLLADFLDHSIRQDPDVFASALWVTLTRAGKDERLVWSVLDSADLFDDVKFTAVDTPSEEVEEESPPVLTPPSTDDGNTTDTSDEPEPSSQTSPKPLELLESPPSPTGFPRSATGAG